MLFKNLRQFQLTKYPLALIYFAIAWNVLEAADVFITRFQLSGTTFNWLSLLLLAIGLGLLITTIIVRIVSSKTKSIKILLVDDHAVVSSGLKMLLEKNTKYNVINEAANGFEALKLMQSNNYDIVFTDINMPAMNGITLCKKIKENHQNTKVIALTMRSDKSTVRRVFDAGASGFLLKSCGLTEIQSAIEVISNGEKYISNGLQPA